MDGFLHTPEPVPIFYQRQDETDEEPHDLLIHETDESPLTPSPQPQPSNIIDDENRDETVISPHHSRSPSPDNNKNQIATSSSPFYRTPSPPISRSVSPSDSILDEKYSDESDDSSKPSENKKKKDTNHPYSKIPQPVQDISEGTVEEYLEKLKNLFGRKMTILKQEDKDKEKEIISSQEKINGKKKELQELEKTAAKKLHEKLQKEAIKFKSRRRELRKKCRKEQKT